MKHKSFSLFGLKSRTSCIQHIRRVLVLAERYISSIEEQHPGPRSLPPHGASFTGVPIILNITCDSNKLDVKLEVSSFDIWERLLLCECA